MPRVQVRHWCAPVEQLLLLPEHMLKLLLPVSPLLQGQTHENLDLPTTSANPARLKPDGSMCATRPSSAAKAIVVAALNLQNHTTVVAAAVGYQHRLAGLYQRLCNGSCWMTISCSCCSSGLAYIPLAEQSRCTTAAWSIDGCSIYVCCQHTHRDTSQVQSALYFAHQCLQHSASQVTGHS